MQENVVRSQAQSGKRKKSVLGTVSVLQDPNDPLWWCWKDGCAVDPETWHASRSYPQADSNGYWRGQMLAPCMTVPVQIHAKTRDKAIRMFKYAWSLYLDYRYGREVKHG